VGAGRGWGRDHYRRNPGSWGERVGGEKLGMGRAEEVWAGDCRMGARRSSAVGGEVVVRVSAMVRRKRIREGYSGIGRLCRIRLKKRALLLAPRSWCCEMDYDRRLIGLPSGLGGFSGEAETRLKIAVALGIQMPLAHTRVWMLYNI
jgi:hypothetical protein